MMDLGSDEKQTLATNNIEMEEFKEISVEGE